MYSARTLAYFEDSSLAGELPPPAVTVEVMQPVCGDILRLSLRWENGVVAQAAFRARGCTASIAAGAALAQWAVGRTVAELAGLKAAAVDELLGQLPAESKHAALLAADTAAQAAKQAR
jgi:nitrogen fixation protein NifU and related proteins